MSFCSSARDICFSTTTLFLRGLFEGEASDFSRMRSMRACLRELTGVSGAVAAFEPRWPTGVDGNESDATDERDGDKEGVLGVSNPKGSSEREWRDEGV